MIKSELRKELKARRKAIGKAEGINKSRKICENLIASAMFKAAETVMVYISFSDEVDTEEIICTAISEGKKVLVPVVEGDMMYAVRLKSTEGLIKGAFGIPEPEIKEKWTESIDICIIPGLGFDRKGGRIGFGKGYYDKFLSKVNCKKIGLAFSEQIENNIYSEIHDVAMDFVVTEEEMFSCG